MIAIKLTIALLSVSNTVGFSTFRPRSFASSMHASTTAEEVPFYAETDEPSIYEKIGIEPEEIGLGIDPEEVFEWIGTRADLEAKILEDNPSFEKSRVSEEASKLYKDAEVLNLMIKFNERMSDPEYRKAYEDMKNANRNVLFTYAGWLGTGLTLSYLNKNYVQPKLDSGEWTLPFGSSPATSGVEAIVTDTLPAVSEATDSIQTSIDVVTSAAGS